MPREIGSRRGYLTIDALVGLAITTLAVTAAVTLAANTVQRVNQSRDRLTAMRVASDLYEDLYAGRRPDGRHAGETSGRAWTYISQSAATADQPSLARSVRITVDRRTGPDLQLDAVVPPRPAPETLDAPAAGEPATPSLN